MRTLCVTSDDFLANLRIEISHYHGRKVNTEDSSYPVHRRAVFVATKRMPVVRTGEDPRSAIKFQVHIVLSAVISTEEGEYLLECGEETGFDYEDGGGERKGSEAAALVVAKVEKFCQDNDLMVRPGIVSY